MAAGSAGPSAPARRQARHAGSASPPGAGGRTPAGFLPRGWWMVDNPSPKPPPPPGGVWERGLRRAGAAQMPRGWMDAAALAPSPPSPAPGCRAAPAFLNDNFEQLPAGPRRRPGRGYKYYHVTHQACTNRAAADQRVNRVTDTPAHPAGMPGTAARRHREPSPRLRSKGGVSPLLPRPPQGGSRPCGVELFARRRRSKGSMGPRR